MRCSFPLLSVLFQIWFWFGFFSPWCYLHASFYFFFCFGPVLIDVSALPLDKVVGELPKIHCLLRIILSFWLNWKQTNRKKKSEIREKTTFLLYLLHWSTTSSSPQRALVSEDDCFFVTLNWSIDPSHISRRNQMSLAPWPVISGWLNWESTLIENQVKLPVWAVPVCQWVCVNVLRGSPWVSADWYQLAQSFREH